MRFLSVIPLFFCGCQIQVNVASSVVNIPVIKTQAANEQAAHMPGSNLEKIAENASQKAGDVKATP